MQDRFFDNIDSMMLGMAGSDKDFIITGVSECNSLKLKLTSLGLSCFNGDRC